MSEKKVKVSLEGKGPDRSYTIRIGRGLLTDLKESLGSLKPSSVVLVAESAFQDLAWFKDLTTSFKNNFTCKVDQILIEGGEQSKEISKISELWNNFQQLGLDRRSLVVNLGGGALCDASGFAASTYMRGVSFVNIPTTLLSQVDASIGGKVAIDHSGVKNLIGTFTQPKAVIIDLETLQSLPDREYRSGFAEIIKHGLIADRLYFKRIEEITIEDRISDQMLDIIHDSCLIKANIVSQDENESGLRKILNFGHTIGHAIESLSIEKYNPLLHGESISLGLVAEGYISHKLDFISKEDLLRIEAICKRVGLPTRFSQPISDQEIISKIFTDKKNVGGQIRWVLLSKIGSAIYDQSVDESIVKESLEYIRNV